MLSAAATPFLRVDNLAIQWDMLVPAMNPTTKTPTGATSPTVGVANCRYSMQASAQVAWGLALLVCLTVGCGEKSGIKKVVVTGTVSYKGTPIANGDIRFDPAPGTAGPVSGAKIINGKYKAAGRGGVPVGDHLVRIRGYHTEGSGGDMLSAQPKQASGGQYIPVTYNKKTSTYVTITGEESQEQHDFALE